MSRGVGAAAESGAAERFLGVQILRGLAAAMVVVFHLGRMAQLRAGADGAATLVGAAGVDLFFVISGFIMAHTTRNGLAPGDFLRRRLARIFPLYALATALAFALSFKTTAGGGGETLARLAASLAFFPTFSPKGEIAPVFEPGWTLQYEAMFYAALALASALTPRNRLVLLAAMLLGAVGAGALLSPRGAALACWTSPLLLEFLAGCLIARLHDAGFAPPPRVAAAMIALGAGLLCAGAALAAGAQFTQHWRWLVWGAPAAVIVAGVVALERTGVFARFASFARWGDRSYALYLTHPFVASLAGLALRDAHGAYAPPVALAAFALSLAVAAVVHARIEQPLARAFSPGAAARAVRVGPARAADRVSVPDELGGQGTFSRLKSFRL
ncbi:Peptidoglycan/LPS O-acetylase OafA/YrhL, contains acyltransferase and SGNH-hydrolase domains [Rhodoblastus acidophilus]|uniref:Peptidoglycan/LPS O-acetylase OafA/YrhL, contains acyltransferase and SGNH-hydrolase domains n=1 Tax=Rhodoblastus acidophilus TaxID=1074 RepID=A0A212REP1_RHOAC|nr:acyltransferase [Rhodoblastus acidophilus]SNB70839.1 Peptidoglycan/LPS O-acetylase OafA/YrhL, contains acyltransferase and SGNH-hydrolase domains [Rhodoblastus acidophilus]